MLDLKIDTYLKVVELGSYTAAAEALHLTQPAVTQHIRKLEEHYGCLLIDSSKHSVRLTDAGRMLYQYLRLQHANERQFLAKLQNLAQPLRIGATLSIADYYLPGPLVSYFLEQHETVSVQVGNTEHLTNLLQQEELDCIFIEGNFDGTPFISHVLCEAQFLPVAAAGHPLAGKPVALEALHAYPLALREAGSGTRELLTAYLHQNNDSPQSFARVVEMGSFVLLKKLIGSSDAVTFVYEGVARQEVQAGTLCFLQLKNYSYIHPLQFIYRKGSVQSEKYEAFFRTVQEKLSSNL